MMIKTTTTTTVVVVVVLAAAAAAVVVVVVVVEVFLFVQNSTIKVDNVLMHFLQKVEISDVIINGCKTEITTEFNGCY